MKSARYSLVPTSSHMATGRHGETLPLQPMTTAPNQETTQNNPRPSISQQEGTRSRTGEETEEGLCDVIITVVGVIIVILTFPLTFCLCFKVIQQYERAAIFRLGRLRPGPKGPGVIFLLPCIEEVVRIDIRTITSDVHAQKILTSDTVTCTVDGVVFYQITHPMRAAMSTGLHNAIGRIAQTTLREILGRRALSNILSDRKQISKEMQKILDKRTRSWGVTVHLLEVKNIIIPPDLQRAMAAEAESSRTARARVIAADGEMKSARALMEAAAVMNESPAAIQLRELQTMINVAGEKESTILFPIPIDFSL